MARVRHARRAWSPALSLAPQSTVSDVGLPTARVPILIFSQSRECRRLSAFRLPLGASRAARNGLLLPLTVCMRLADSGKSFANMRLSCFLMATARLGYLNLVYSSFIILCGVFAISPLRSCQRARRIITRRPILCHSSINHHPHTVPSAPLCSQIENDPCNSPPTRIYA